jgi:hypothetical protein
MRCAANRRATRSALFAALSLSLSLSLSLTTACQKETETTPTPMPVPTTVTPTSAIVDIEADGSGKTAVAVCIEEPNGLTCGRKKGSTEGFEASSDDEKVPLQFQLAAKGSDDYEAGAFVGSLTGDAAGKVIAVAWDGDAAFEATLPSPFEITEPAVAAVFSLADGPITVKWAPSGEADIIEWSYSGKCSNGNWTAPGGQEDDEGELVIPVEGFSNLPPDGCSVTIEMGRRRKGTVDMATKREGFISAAQVRNATFTVKP